MSADTRRIVEAVKSLTPNERHMLTCALVGNFPDGFSELRPTMLRALAIADHEERTPDPGNDFTVEASDFTVEVGDQHRVIVEFGGDTYLTKLIHPEHCAGADSCGQCGRSFTDPDPDTEPCFDCPTDPEAARTTCWVQGWFDDATAGEILHGSVELVVQPTWEFDHCELHIVTDLTNHTNQEDECPQQNPASTTSTQ